MCVQVFLVNVSTGKSFFFFWKGRYSCELRFIIFSTIICSTLFVRDNNRLHFASRVLTFNNQNTRNNFDYPRDSIFTRFIL